MDGDPHANGDEFESEDAWQDGPDGHGDGPAPEPSGDAAARLQALVTYLARNLVDDPETVEVDAQQRGGSVFLTLRVPEEELGKVIGRQGRIARAIRTALMVAGSRQHVRASLDIEG